VLDRAEKVAQGAPNPIYRPCHHEIEPTPIGVLEHPIECPALVAPLRTADPKVLIDLYNRLSAPLTVGNTGDSGFAATARGMGTHSGIATPYHRGDSRNGTKRFPSLWTPRIVPSNRRLRFDGPPVFPYSTANSRKISQALRRPRIVPCVYGLLIARQRGRRCRRCRRKSDKIAFWKIDPAFYRPSTLFKIGSAACHAPAIADTVPAAWVSASNVGFIKPGFRSFAASTACSLRKATCSTSSFF
jgi:hypothetical protein